MILQMLMIQQRTELGGVRIQFTELILNKICMELNLMMIKLDAQQAQSSTNMHSRLLTLSTLTFAGVLGLFKQYFDLSMQ